jgi:hypothetical protein
MALPPWLAVVLLSCLPQSGGRPAEGGEPSRPRLLVPAYFYPEGEGLRQWDRLLSSAAEDEVVAIVNPASGPGRRADPNYVAILERSAGTRLIPIGYVTTSYARRPVEEVKADVDRWVELYPEIRGIFFDEQASGPEHVDYQASLYEYVKKDRRLELVIANPGTGCAEGFFRRATADSTCLFEGPRRRESLRFPGWAAGYPASRVAALPYEVESAGAMRDCVREAIRAGVGYLYVTDAGGSMPWDRLPRYWEEEVRAVRHEAQPEPGSGPGAREGGPDR